MSAMSSRGACCTVRFWTCSERAETLGSAAPSLVFIRRSRYCVGLEVNANHLRGVRDGIGHRGCPADPYRPHIARLGIEIRTADERLVCVARLTAAVIGKPD